MNKALVMAQLWGMKQIEEFLNSEEGDTNFISMLLIIGIVVVLATLFLTLGKGVMTTISTNVQNFLSGL